MTPTDNPMVGRIRDAMASGEYQRAHLLWNEYATQLLEDARRGQLSEARFREAGELVKWSRRVVLCARAQAQNRIRSFQVAQEYTAQTPTQPRFLQTRL